MSKIKNPTIYIPARFRDYLDSVCLASAGPRPNITGMRKIWGENARIIKSGVYIYNVSEKEYNSWKGWRRR